MASWPARLSCLPRPARPELPEGNNVTDIVSFISEHSTAVMIGAGAGIVAAKVLHAIERVSRLVLSAVVLAVAGGGGAGLASNALSSLTTLK